MYYEREKLLRDLNRRIYALRVVSDVRYHAVHNSGGAYAYTGRELSMSESARWGSVVAEELGGSWNESLRLHLVRRSSASV